MSQINKLKVVCLLLFGAGFVAVLLTNNLFNRTAQAFSFGLPDGYTGAPGEQLCTSCHAGVPDTGPGRFTIDAPPSYVPGQTYRITVQHATGDVTRVRWGFHLTVLTLNNISERVGNLQSLDGFTTVTDAGPSFALRQYVSHNSSGTFIGQTGGASWTFNWTAPPTDVGPVAFYAAGNQANGIGSGGDQIYTARVITLPPVPLESITDPRTLDDDGAPSTPAGSTTLSR